jgi:hypothetical protein
VFVSFHWWRWCWEDVEGFCGESVKKYLECEEKGRGMGRVRRECSGVQCSAGGLIARRRTLLCRGAEYKIKLRCLGDISQSTSQSLEYNKNNDVFLGGL